MTKGTRGRPKHASMNNLQSIQEKIELELRRFDANTANNLSKYFQVIEDMALGKAKGSSPTNQISCAKMLIERAEKFLEEQNADENGGVGDEKEEKQEDTSAKPLISLAYNGE